ncbi:hypothetical protein JRG19_09125 [Pseudoclavibacter alba]|uniref:Uncharacterized protein n=1 Tax=Pseudoclavibacter albus TaxID=272241 RepID=A0ABT2HUU6_9MICO|nr:hypothetical protein [Pseudoclavibacter alba]MBN6778692.1 hypothetical protein [Pseudoclavibacter alba]MCT2042098.1 hypothetical protein [Pseudoclavibacter alba]
MYGAIWRALPGPWFVKLLFALIFIVTAIIVLVAWVFPWADLMFLPQDVTVGALAKTAVLPLS